MNNIRNAVFYLVASLLFCFNASISAAQEAKVKYVIVKESEEISAPAQKKYKLQKAEIVEVKEVVKPAAPLPPAIKNNKTSNVKIVEVTKETPQSTASSDVSNSKEIQKARKELTEIKKSFIENDEESWNKTEEQKKEQIRLAEIAKEKAQINGEKGQVLAKLRILRQEENAKGLTRWKSYVETSGDASTSGRKIGMADAFLVVKEFPDSIIFADIRSQLDNNSSNEYNIGAGYRHLFDNNILGAYIFYDRRSSSNNNIFNQLTLGGESLGTVWDFRGNIYLPQNKEEEVSSEVFVKDNKLQASYSTEKALTGTDFEVGHVVPLGNSRAFLGGYYFFDSSSDGLNYDSVSGARARLESKFFHDYLTIGGTSTYDKDLKLNASAYLRVRMPIGAQNIGRKLTTLEKRMTDTIIRDVDIVTGEFKGTTNNLTINNNAQTANNVQFVNINGSSDVDNSIEAIAPNSLIVVSGTGSIGNGAANADAIDLKQGQTLLAGNGALAVSYKDARGTVHSGFYRPNLAAATINNNNTVVTNTLDTIVINQESVAVESINFVGRNTAATSNSVTSGIRINNTNALNVSLNNLNFTNVGNGVMISGAANGSAPTIGSGQISNINMSNLNINGTQQNGINILGSFNDNFNITNLTTNNIGANNTFYGVSFVGTNLHNGSKVTVTNHTHTNSTGAKISGTPNTPAGGTANSIITN